MNLLHEVSQGGAAPQTLEWLDYETTQYIEDQLSEAADCHSQWLTDVCGLDDLFDVGATMRAWWDEQVRLFRFELLRQWQNEQMTTRSGGWHEDFELESRRHLAFLSHTFESPL